MMTKTKTPRKVHPPPSTLAKLTPAETKLSVLELFKSFDPTIELENTIAHPPKEPTKARKRTYDSDDEPRTNGKKLNGKRKHESDEEDDEEEDEEEDEWANNEDDADPEASRKKKRMSMIKQHLELLAEDSFKFIRLESNRGMGEWSVNYKELGKLMKQIEIEKVVEERFGSMGTRLLRIIKEKGRIDEKQVTPPSPLLPLQPTNTP